MTAPSQGAYRDPCWKCKGTGFWNGPGDCRGDRRCTACNGAGYKEFKTSPEVRAAERAKTAARERAKREDSLRTWQAMYPDETEWLRSAVEWSEFARDMVAILKAGKKLSAGQQAAVTNATAKAKAKAEAKAREQRDQAVAAKTVSIEPIETCLQSARQKGLLYPKLRLADFVFAPAKAGSRNPEGTIYVTDRESDTYLGKVLGGKLFRSRDCTDAAEARILEVAADPLNAAIAYGKKWGKCAICNRDLSDPVSVERGIGPICAEKFGW